MLKFEGAPSYNEWNTLRKGDTLPGRSTPKTTRPKSFATVEKVTNCPVVRHLLKEGF